jgi:hypothetical protein
MEKTNAREYLVSKGFNPGSRGRFSKEMIQVLNDSGLTFTRPVKEPTGRKKVSSVPLV